MTSARSGGTGGAAGKRAGSTTRSRQGPAAPSKRTGAPPPLLTRAEASDYRETSLHADVLEFLKGLTARTDAMRVLSMGPSGENRDIAVAVLSRNRLFTPEQARAAGKPIVMVLANIHAGEVEGKEACLMLARDITTGKLGRLMSAATILLVPDYNPDGNDRIDPSHRRLDLKALEGQDGPPGGVGTRYTAAGINLNRDYMKLEAVESRHLSRLYGAWRPHLFIDCHTTDGSIHGYDLTFDTAHTLESGPRGPILYVRDELLPAISRSLRERTGLRTFFYGNFKDPEDPSRGWETYPALPRYGSHYRGLTGRMDVLLEAYSYLDFRSRCRVMYETLVEILDYAGRHGGRIRRIVDAAEEETVGRGREPEPDDTVGVGYGVAGRDDKGVLIYEYPVHPLRTISCEAWDAASLKLHRFPGARRQTFRTIYFGRFVPIVSARRPRAYVLPASASQIVERLRLHNIAVRTLDAPADLAVEQFVVMGRDRTVSPDVGSASRMETVLWVRPERARYAGEPGDFRIDMDQPLADVAIYLLEPESDDGLVRWGFFDDVRIGDVYPVRRVMP